MACDRSDAGPRARGARPRHGDLPPTPSGHRELELAAAAVGAWLILLAAAPELLRSDRLVGTTTGALALVALCVGLALGIALVARKGAIGFIAGLPFVLLVLPEFALHTKWSLLAALGGIALVDRSDAALSHTCESRLMRVGLSLLTLIPGISGGSETLRTRARSSACARRVERVRRTRPPARTGRGRRAPGDRCRALSELDVHARPTARDGWRVVAAGSSALAARRCRRRPLPADRARFRDPTEPHVLTLLDVQHLDLPQLFPRGERLFRKLAYDRASRKATEVIVISEFVRERVIERLALDPCPRARRLARRRSRTVHPHAARRARTAAALSGAPVAPQESRTALRGVCAASAARGRTSGSSSPASDTTPPRFPTASRLVPCPERSSSTSIARAACLVFPSLYEGFGLPPIEAMACGCPVAAARAGSLPEVCGDAAVLFDPLDPEAIAAGVHEALDRSAELSERGIARAATFTWDETARAHDRIYSLFS